MNMMDECALLEAARRFDKDALTKIFDLYASALYKYGLHLCHDASEADNIVGDVFAQLLEQLAAGNGPRSNLRSYLYQIAYHIVVNQVRYSSRVTSLDGETEPQDSKCSVHGQIEDMELMRSLQTALETQLTDDQRHVIILRFMEGFSLLETAEITGKSVNAVKVIQSRGIDKLQKVLNPSLIPSIDL